MFTSRVVFVSVALAGLLPLSALAQNSPPAAAPAAAPVIAAPHANAAPVAGANTPITRQELPELVKKILMDDPDILMQVAQKAREKQMADARKQAEEALATHKDELFNDPNIPSIGDAKTADVHIAEFFDYHCGYCKQLLPAIQKLVNEDKKVRVVFMDYPILSEDSATAAKAALSVNRIAKDKYFEFHSALMKTQGKFDEKAVLDIAKKLGINGDKLKAEMNKPEVAAQIEKNHALGETLGVRGTPAIVIGNQLFPGAMSYQDLKQEIANARTKPAAKKAAAATAPAAPTPASAEDPAAVAAEPAIAPAPAVAAPAEPAAPPTAAAEKIQN